MAENIRAIEIKKRRLKEELNKDEPDKKIIRGIKESIRRHKQTSIKMRNNRNKVKKRNEKN